MSDELICDHASVGVIARDEQGRILMIQRRKYPFGFAPPAGHLDGLTYPLACHKEFEEETGLKVVGAPKPLIPKNPKKGLPFGGCRRGGEYHHWQIFEVQWAGELKLNKSETKFLGWMKVEEIKKLAERTKEYLSRWHMARKAEEASWTSAIRESLDKGWEKSPGLEVVWYEFFQELGII